MHLYLHASSYLACPRSPIGLQPSVVRDLRGLLRGDAERDGQLGRVHRRAGDDILLQGRHRGERPVLLAAVQDGRLVSGYFIPIIITLGMFGTG